MNLEVKIKPKNVSVVDKVLAGKYFSGITFLSTALKPKFIKLEALYQNPGNKVTSKEINKEANGFAKDFLTAFKQRPFNIDAFDNFVIKYQDNEGAEQVFNLLKGKKEIIKEIDAKTITKNRQIYEMIEQDFNEYMEELKK